MGPGGRPEHLGIAGALSAPADLLATLAGELGVEWDGPGSPDPQLLGSIEAHLPDAPPWERLDALREATLDPVERRKLGAHHTPPDLARRLCRLAVDGVDASTAVVLDPACGGGAFLVAAAELLVSSGLTPTEALARVHGIDVDPLAAATARAALRCWAGEPDAEVDVVTGDGLGEWPVESTTGSIVVVGNPPFRSPLDAGDDGEAAAALRSELAAPYADLAALFLLRSLRSLCSVGEGGRVLLIQPESVLSSRDARRVREAATPHLDGLWIAGEKVFGASVRVCAPLLVASPGRRVRRWSGASVRRRQAASRPAATSWAPLRAADVPTVRSRATGGRIGDLATATAGFRDEYYAIAAAVREGGAGAPVVTSGLVEPGRLDWGGRPARIGGRRLLHPVVSVDDLADERVARWVAARLRPKVLVATQTRVLEAAPDPEGVFVPLTPVLSVEPHDDRDVWRLAAALTAPQVTAWALRHHGGTALSADAVKLSARQLLDAPLPADQRAWDEAADHLRHGDVDGCGEVFAAEEPALLDWWRARLPRGKRES